jgi:hypothetical protein
MRFRYSRIQVFINELVYVADMTRYIELLNVNKLPLDTEEHAWKYLSEHKRIMGDMFSWDVL